MASRSEKSAEKLKKEKQHRNFNVAEIEFIKANASTMNVNALAEALDASISEIKELIRQYNDGTGNFVRDSYIVGKDRMVGTIVATQASSEIHNEINVIKPKEDPGHIFRMKKNVQ